jgi:hypothetical protein
MQNLGSRDISQAAPFGDTSDEITGIPVICEYVDICNFGLAIILRVMLSVSQFLRAAIFR